MKITVSELRQLIREAISQINYPPGRWEPTEGDSLEREEPSELYYDGFAGGLEEEAEEETEETKEKPKK